MTVNTLERLFGRKKPSRIKRMQTKIKELEAVCREARAREKEARVLSKAQAKQMRRLGNRIDVLADLIGDILQFNAPSNRGEYKTAQERAWSEKHGFRYVVHHLDENWEVTRMPQWQTFLELTPDVTSVFEFGCNIGANLKAIALLRPETRLAGMDINPAAITYLKREEIADVYCGSIISEPPTQEYDLVFSRGVLIHINPTEVDRVIQNMAKVSSKYVLLCENYSQAIVEPDGYARRVIDRDREEGYQFWQNYSNRFKTLFPAWEVVETGVGLEKGKSPSHGELHWTIFKKPK